MTKQNKAFKFRIYPNKEQKELLAKTFGCVRFVYNKMLAERKETYEKFKDDKEKLKEQKFPTPAKYKDEFPFLKEVDSLALANAQIHLQNAYKNFLKVVQSSLNSKVKNTSNPIQPIWSMEILRWKMVISNYQSSKIRLK